MMSRTARATCPWFAQRFSWHGRYYIQCGKGQLGQDERQRLVPYGTQGERDAVYTCYCVGGRDCPRRAALDKMAGK